MLVDFTKVKNIFIVCSKTDMRKGIDGLARIVQYEYNMDCMMTRYSCFAVENPIVSRRSIGMEMDLYSCTSA